MSHSLHFSRTHFWLYSLMLLQRISLMFLFSFCFPLRPSAFFVRSHTSYTYEAMLCESTSVDDGVLFNFLFVFYSLFLAK